MFIKKKIYLIFILFILTASAALYISTAYATTYTYDTLLRITRADYANGFTETYTYDPSGNRQTIAVSYRQISGTGYIYSQQGHETALSLNIRADSPGTGRLTYSDTRLGLSLLSSSIVGLVIDNDKAVITGTCTLNDLTWCSFRATVTDTDHDTMAIDVYGSDNTLYFSSGTANLNNGSFSINRAPPDLFMLTTSASPAYSGTISPDCPHGCLYENCTTVTITANTDNNHSFVNWNGCDSAVNNICIISMDGERNAEAVFGSCQGEIRITGENPVYYSSIQNSYDSSLNNNIIQMRSTLLSGDIYFDRNIPITLQGGFTCAYGTVSGMTRLKGSITISSGNVTVGNIILE